MNGPPVLPFDQLRVNGYCAGYKISLSVMRLLINFCFILMLLHAMYYAKETCNCVLFFSKCCLQTITV